MDKALAYKSVCRFADKLRTMMKICTDLSELSTCKMCKCGSIITTTDFSAINSIGYNGPPFGQANDRCAGYEAHNTGRGPCGCAHADTNALAKMNPKDGPFFLFTSRYPDSVTTMSIINCKAIQFVVVIDDLRVRTPVGTLPANHKTPIDLMTDAGINVMFAKYLTFNKPIPEEGEEYDTLQEWWLSCRVS